MSDMTICQVKIEPEQVDGTAHSKANALRGQYIMFTSHTCSACAVGLIVALVTILGFFAK